MIEYWQPDPDENFAQPKPPTIAWTYKSDTDLYTFKKVIIRLNKKIKIFFSIIIN